MFFVSFVVGFGYLYGYRSPLTSSEACTSTSAHTPRTLHEPISKRNQDTCVRPTGPHNKQQKREPVVSGGKNIFLQHFKIFEKKFI